MTENEALNTLHILLAHEKAIDAGEIVSTNNLHSQEKEALQFILEEIQAYRAIGTVDELEAMKKGTLSAMELADIWCILEDLKKYSAIGTIEEFKAFKEKNNKDFELLLKCVKESYPMFKGAYVELDVFMGDVMRRFTRDRKQS